MDRARLLDGRAWLNLLQVSFLAALLLALSACAPGGSFADDEKDQNITAGKIQRRSGFYAEAEEAFQRALQNHPKSATAHYELGLLYYENMTNYPAALYHFERYRQLRPRPANEDVLKLMIIECKRELAKDVPLGSIGLQQQKEIQRLRDTNTLLSVEVERLRQQLATRIAPTPAPEAESKPPAATPTPLPAQTPTPATNRGAPAAVAPAVRYHTVRPGETLAAIARRYRIELPALVAANPGIDPRRMQVGQQVVVPTP